MRCWQADQGVCVVEGVCDAGDADPGSAVFPVHSGDLVPQVVVVVGEFADAFVR
jgi:hypothetical protein